MQNGIAFGPQHLLFLVRPDIMCHPTACISSDAACDVVSCTATTFSHASCNVCAGEDGDTTYQAALDQAYAVQV